MKWKYSRDSVAIGVLVITIFFFFYRYLFPKLQLIITPDFGQSDAIGSFAYRFYLHSQIALHRIPLWTSQIGGGYPIHALGFMGTFFLPNLLYFSLIPPTGAYTLSLMTVVITLAIGMYLWLREMQFGIMASIFGSITLALCGYVITQFTHIAVIQSLSLFPLLAYGCLVLAKKMSWITVGWISILFAQQILAGFPQSVFITGLFFVTYFFWLIRLTHHKIFSILQMGVAILIALPLSAIQLIPTVEFSRQILSLQEFSPDATTMFSFPIKHLLTLIHPYALGNPAIGTYPHFLAFDGSIYWENIAYIGVIPIICLLGYGAWCIRNKKRLAQIPPTIAYSIALLGAALLLMTGKYSPIYFIYTFWPFTLFRVPSRFIWLFLVALVLITSYAFDQLLRLVNTKRLTVLVATFLIMCQIFTIFYIWSPYHDSEPAEEWLKDPSFVQYLTPNTYTYTVGGERLFNNTYTDNGWSTKDQNDRPSYVLRNTFTPDKSMIWGVSTINDYAGRDIKRSKILNDLLSQTITSNSTQATVSALGLKLLSAYSIGNIISTLPLNHQGLLKKAELSDPKRVIALYHNPEAAPRVYMATQTIHVTTVTDAIEALKSDTFIPGKTALVEDDSMTSSPSGTHPTVSIQSAYDGYYRLHIDNSEAPAVLVISETYYPGWHIIVDGKETDVKPLNVKNFGAYIPKGVHSIEVRFYPQSFQVGAWISGVTTIAIVALMVFLRLKPS